MQEQEEIMIYPKVTKMLVGSLAFVLLGSGLVYGGVTSDNMVIAIVGIICALFFGAGLVFAVTKLFQSAPALLINKEGIVDKSSYVSAGAVAWDEIKNIHIYQIKNEKFIGIEVYDPDHLMSRHPAWKRKLMRMNKGMTGATIHISASSISANVYELFPLLYRRWNASKSSPDQMLKEENML
ncbi:STM3941 family protein [Paenibacillus sp. NPDC093718]|uniref:STM3941 family protein n=1 Tax=Paenibacillus sp. NPDC093718 TaxID=3390601 RepID=UPI003D084203